jgi:hypothetical protein
LLAMREIFDVVSLPHRLQAGSYLKPASAQCLKWRMLVNTIAMPRSSAAAIQPGGSVRDAEVIAAADERGMAMVFTSIRHFKH